MADDGDLTAGELVEQNLHCRRLGCGVQLVELSRAVAASEAQQVRDHDVVVRCQQAAHLTPGRRRPWDAVEEYHRRTLPMALVAETAARAGAVHRGPPFIRPTRHNQVDSLAVRDRKTYGQFCALARALDHVGDRWTLLIVRELLPGPRRFAELLAGLPGVAPNLLVDRLRSLQASGIVERSSHPPRSASVTYTLTDLGRGLEPSVHALIRWGAVSIAPAPAAAASIPAGGAIRTQGTPRRAHHDRSPWPSRGPHRRRTSRHRNRQSRQTRLCAWFGRWRRCPRAW